jgi:Uri superfamily endonuclease
MKATMRGLPGVYVLLFSLPQEATVSVGRLGEMVFPPGWYAYVGSGMGGVEGRIRRHLSHHKRPHWHLDYLLPHGQPGPALVGYTKERLECSLAAALGQAFPVVPRFGSSDCRCSGHLFRSDQQGSLLSTSRDAMQRLGCDVALIPASQ